MSRRWPEAPTVLDGDFATSDEWYTDQQVFLEEYGGFLDRENIKRDSITDEKLAQQAFFVWHEEIYGYDDVTFEDIEVKGMYQAFEPAMLVMDTLEGFLDIEVKVLFNTTGGGGDDPADERHLLGVGIWLDGFVYAADAIDQRIGTHTQALSLVVPVLPGEHRLTVAFWINPQSPGNEPNIFDVRVMGVTVHALEERA